MGSDLLSIGSSGLFTAKKKLQTAGHNIANVHTEGFSRQRANAVAASPVGQGGTMTGTGSYIKSVERVHSDFLEERLQGNVTAHNYNQQRAELLSVVEEIFNEINYEGLDHSISKFFNSFRELSNTPDSETLRSVVRDQGSILVNHFKKTNHEIQRFVKNIDRQLEESVANINSLMDSVSHLNVKIQEVELVSGEAGDLRDERELALRQLAEYFNVESYLDEKGHFVVNAKGVGTLISGQVVQHLSLSSSDQEDALFPASREIVFGNAFISKSLKSGKIAAIFDTRNDEIVSLKNKIDEVAYLLTKNVNQIHNQGFVNKKVSFDPEGNPLPNNGNVTGVNFFNPLEKQRHSAEYIDLNPLLQNDLNLICSALSPNAPGDNRVAIAISKLQNEPIDASGRKTLEEDFLQIVSTIGMAANRANLDTEQSEGILAQTKALKERLSGVSIDEETADMVKQQHAYDAAARVLKIADEMFKAVLNIKS